MDVNTGVQILIYLKYFLQVYYYFIIIVLLLSWFPSIRSTNFYRDLFKVADIYLGPFRRLIPPAGVINVSILVALVLYNILLYLLNSTIVTIIVNAFITTL